MKRMAPKLSVIVPVYNVEPYLEKCLSSLCEQTLPDIEIIIVNDGSTDGCEAIIQRYADKDQRIRHLFQANAGVSAARNAGLALASGEYIAFVDADDWAEREMLEILYRLAAEHDADLAVCGRRDIREHESVVTSGDLKDKVFSIKELGTENFLLRKRHELGVIVWNKIYRHRIIRDHQMSFEYNKDVFNEDILFNICFQLHCDKVACTTRVLYNYVYRRPGSLITAARPGIESQIVNSAVFFHQYLIRHKMLQHCRTLSALFMLEMASNAYFHTYHANRNKYGALQKTYRELAGTAVYRELLADVIKYKVPFVSKLRAFLFLLKPYWLAALLTDLAYVMGRRTGT